MKIKLLIGLAVAATIGSNTFALEITKGKSISHKEWATSGAIASYLPGSKTRQSIQLDVPKEFKLSNSQSTIIADTQSTTANIGKPVSISNDGGAWIFNSSNNAEQYTFNLFICADHDANMTECVYSEDIVELQPGGYVSEALQPTLTLNYDKPGVYNLYAQTFYIGDHNTSRAISISTGTITVS